MEIFIVLPFLILINENIMQFSIRQHLFNEMTLSEFSVVNSKLELLLQGKSGTYISVCLSN